MRAMFEPRAGRSTVLATLVLAAACALFSSQAQAASLGVTGYLGAMGSAGTAEAQFKNPRGVAVNETTGDVYVADSSNHRIQQFDALGNFVRTWGKNVGGPGIGVCTFMCQAGSAGTLGGEFNGSYGIAVDQADGSVYVSDQVNIRLQKFDASGNFLWAVGRDVAQPAGGTTTEVCAVAANCKAGTTGGGGGEFASGFVGFPTVDPTSHHVYVADPGNRRVQELDSSGTFVRAFGWDVALPAGDDAFEVCTDAASCKVAAVGGTGAGRFGTGGPARVVTDDHGVVYAVDAGNKRVQKFTPSAGPTSLIASDFAPSVLSAASLPSDIAFDPVTGDLLAVAKPDPGSNERRVLELDTSGNVVDTYLSGAGVTSVNGIAGRAPGGRIYVSCADSRGQVVLILGTPLAPPTATIAPVTGAAGGSATLNATVNPGGSQFSTGAHFEYSDDGTSWTKAPATDVDLGNGSTDVPVSQAVSGLDPNTTYHVRVVATRPFGAGSATSGETTFTTPPIPPVLSAVDSFQLSDATAGLRGRVNPKKAATSYHFEYGTDTGYGQSTPTRGAGAGASPTAISEKLADLRPGTTYHFRLVASNAAGATESPDRTFTTLAAPRAAGRAYELVSPADKNGGDVVIGFHASDDGNAVAYATNAARDDAYGVTAASYAVARRGPEGWASASADASVRESAADESGTAARNILLDVSTDFRRVVQVSTAGLTPEDQDLNGLDYYLIDLARSNAAALVSSGPTPPDVAQPESMSYVGASTDLRRIYFSINGGPYMGVYEWSDGTLRLASALPDGTGAPGARPADTIGDVLGAHTARAHRGTHVVSDDGSRLFFLGGTLPSSTDRPLYLRQGNTTIPISASRKAGQEGTLAGATFVGASHDGSVVYFVSDAQLTDAATPGGGLYRYDPDSASVLEQITPSTGGLPASFVIHDAKVSDDSSHVYFTSLMAFSPEAVLGENNLYVWDKQTGTTTFITVLSGAIEQTSRSGRFALLSSDASIDGAPTNNHEALYLYDATKGALHCVSCRPDGSDSEGEVITIPEFLALPDPGYHAVARGISDDGRVYFTTKDRLLPGDRNTRYDVYEYDDGYLSLISSGRGSHDSFLADNSDDGRDVFFTTRDGLVPQDVDGGGTDLYDARVGGGIAAAETPSPRCRGDECQDDEPPTVPAATPGSATFFQDEVSSAPDAAPHGAASFRVGKVSAAAARAMARTGKLKLSVKVGAGGKVKATVSASVKGRRTRVATATRATTRAGTVRLVIRLSKQARAELRRKGRLRLRIVVAFSAAKRSSAATVTLTAPRSSKTAKAR